MLYVTPLYSTTEPNVSPTFLGLIVITTAPVSTPMSEFKFQKPATSGVTNGAVVHSNWSSGTCALEGQVTPFMLQLLVPFAVMTLIVISVGSDVDFKNFNFTLPSEAFAVGEGKSATTPVCPVPSPLDLSSEPSDTAMSAAV